MRKALAILLLALCLFGIELRRVAGFIGRRWFGVKTDGAGRFFANFRHDRIYPVAASEAAFQLELPRCIRCGLCDSLCRLTPGVPRARFDGPSLVASTHSRSLTDAACARAYAEALKQCENCHRCAEVCPTQVPIKAIVAWIGRLPS